MNLESIWPKLLSGIFAVIGCVFLLAGLGSFTGRFETTSGREPIAFAASAVMFGYAFILGIIELSGPDALLTVNRIDKRVWFIPWFIGALVLLVALFVPGKPDPIPNTPTPSNTEIPTVQLTYASTLTPTLRPLASSTPVLLTLTATRPTSTQTQSVIPTRTSTPTVVRPTLTPSSTATPMSPTTTSTLPPPTAVPLFLVVPGNLPSIRYTHTGVTGVYEVRIDSGAYSPWSEDRLGTQWRTRINIYRGTSFQYGQSIYGSNTPINPELAIGCGDDFDTKDEAEGCGTSQPPRRIDIQEGESLLFVPIDYRPSYRDNRGEVRVRLTLVPR
jgi:hypothetical protein